MGGKLRSREGDSGGGGGAAWERWRSPSACRPVGGSRDRWPRVGGAVGDGGGGLGGGVVGFGLGFICARVCFFRIFSFVRGGGSPALSAAGPGLRSLPRPEGPRRRRRRRSLAAAPLRPAPRPALCPRPLARGGRGPSLAPPLPPLPPR